MTDWKTVQLGEVCTLQRGMDLPKRLRHDGEFPLVTSSGIDGTHSVGPVKGPGVITGRYGTIGKVFFVEPDFWPLNTTLYVRDFHGNDVRFVHHLLQTVDFQSHSGKSGVPGVNRNDVHQEFVHIPARRSEQEAIAKALLDADALIDSMEQLLTKKRQIKQGAMQELLTGKRRLPGFRENWDETTFADVALIDPENLGSGTRADFAFNYIALEGVDQGRLVSFTETQFDGAPSRARRVLREGDVLVATVRPNLKSHLLFDAPHGHWIASTGFSVVRCKAGTACPGFLFALLFSSIVERQIDALLTGSNYPAINGRDVANLAFARPPFEEQVAIAQVLSDMADEITALEARLSKARALKQAMAQALLTGRIRLVEPTA